MLGYQYSEWNNYSTSSFQTTISTINFQAWSMLLPKLQNSVLFPATFCNFASKQAVPSVMQNVPSVMISGFCFPLYPLPVSWEFLSCTSICWTFFVPWWKGMTCRFKKKCHSQLFKIITDGTHYVPSVMVDLVMVHCHKQGRKVTGHISMSVFQGCPRTLLVCCRVVINPLGLFEVKYSNILLPKSRFLSRP